MGLKTKDLTINIQRGRAQPQRQETRHAYYFWHHKNHPYHIDYVFLPQHWASQIKRVEVGTHAAWSKLSDHVPSAST